MSENTRKRGPYHAEHPLDPAAVKVDTRVSVPKWHRSEVMGWVNGTVIEVTERTESPGTTYLVRLDDGAETIYFAYSIAAPQGPRDPMEHTGPVFGMWWGGSGYSHGEGDKDGERFASIEAAKDALVSRYTDGYGYRQQFAFVNREPEGVLCPAVSENTTIDLVLALPEGGDFTDVYPDLRITLTVDEDGEATAHVESC
jgi:hypothetical protein